MQSELRPQQPPCTVPGLASSSPHSVPPQEHATCASTATCTPEEEEVQACAEAEKLAMAKLNKVMLVSTYRKDYNHHHRHNSIKEKHIRFADDSHPPDSRQSQPGTPPPGNNTVATAKGNPLYTTMNQDYQPQPLVSSLRNKTTRYGYSVRSLARGTIPNADGDMYRDPIYMSSSYKSEYVHHPAVDSQTTR